MSPTSDAVIDSMRALRSGGMSLSDVADECGVSPGTVRRYTVGNYKGYKTETSKAAAKAAANGHDKAAAAETPKKRRGAKAVVPAGWECPHCGGAVKLPA